MNTSVKTICNFNCICIDNDCKFSHFISIKDRKTTRRIYDTLDNINKNETNPEKRKANCRYGQLCNNPDCGFRQIAVMASYAIILIADFATSYVIKTVAVSFSDLTQM